MTNEYKNMLLKYLNGTLPQETGDNIPQFGDVNIITNNLYDFMLRELGLSGQFFITGIIQGKNAKNQNLEYSILYGYSVNNKYSKAYGFIILLDDNFNVVELITKYSSGTILGPILSLNVGDDGCFFGIEQNYETLTKRFVMLNNICMKLPNQEKFTIILRQSYNLPENISNSTVQYNAILKANGQSKYLISGGIVQEGTIQPIATELTVNVGSSNNWVEYRYNDYFIGNGVAINDTWANWDSSGNLDFKIIGFNNDSYCEYYKNNENISVKVFPINYPIETFYEYSMSAKILNKTLSYIAIYGNDVQLQNAVFYIFKTNYETGVADLIYTKTTPQSEDYEFSCIKLFANGTNVYYLITSSDSSVGDNFNYCIGRIIDSSVYEKFLQLVPVEEMTLLNIFNVSNQFNLFNYFIQIGNTCYHLNEIFNEFNYNGKNYINSNSLKPKYSTIYDENKNIIFSRNLYNFTLNMNSSTAVLEIPNQYLNNVNIKFLELVGETKQSLAINDKLISKNIYERVLINYQNSLTIYENSTPNINNSIKINNSINVKFDYENVKMNKYKINYKKDVSDTFWNGESTLFWNGNSNEVYQENNKVLNLPYPITTNNESIYVINLNTCQGIENIQFISNDESIIYYTIDLSNYEKNKKIKINQKVEVN